MPTVTGAIFFFAGACCFFVQEDCLLGLLIIASTFQAASAINLGDRGIQPFYMIEGFVILRALVNSVLGRSNTKSLPQSKWLITFGAISFISALILPYMFAGVPIYDPKIGPDDSLFIRPPLSFGINNIAQTLFLVWHIAASFAIVTLDFSSKRTRSAYTCAFYMVVLLVIAQTVCDTTGLTFHDSLIRNNPGYSNLPTGSGATRKTGPFAEQSFAGAFVGLYCIGFVAEYLAGRGSRFAILVALVASGLITSSGSLLALALSIIALLIFHFPYRFPWYLHLQQTKRALSVVILLAIPMVPAILFSSAIKEALVTNTVAKGDSGSFINRTTADLYALQLLVRTFGLGVGLGSNRASGLIPTLLSNVGIAGFASFSIFSIRLLGKLSEKYAWFRWAAFYLLLNMSLDVPDVTFPTLWMVIMIAASIRVNSISENPELPPQGSMLAIRYPSPMPSAPTFNRHA